jgi:hypothetical protein
MTMALLLAAGTLSLQAQTYPAAVLSNNPAGYWRLQETSGTVAADSSASGSYGGSYTNAVLGQPGFFPSSNPTEVSAEFGGVAGYSTDSYVGGIPLDLASTSNEEFSVEAWVNGGYGQVAGAGIVGKGPGGSEEFFLDCGAANNAFRFYIRESNNTAVNANSTNLPDGNWHHLVGVCDEVNGNIYLYVDGQLKVTAAATGGIHSTTNLYMTIGCRQSAANGDYNNQFSGNIAEVAVYTNALTAQQVLNHYYAAGIPPTITVLPPSSTATNEGATLTIAAAATGSPPLSYMWATNYQGNYVAIPGQTNASFVMSNVSASISGEVVYFFVTNHYGEADDVANPNGTLVSIISGPPSAVSIVQPSQNSLFVGQPWTYSVVVGSGTQPYYYQWFANGVTVSGATNSSYTFNTIPGTNSYSVNVSNTFNGGSVTPSSPVTLVGVAVPTNSYTAAIYAGNPVAYWRLDEADNGSGNTGSTAYDYMGGHVGTYSQVQLGVPGYSLFDADTAALFGTNAGYSSGSLMQEVNYSAVGFPTVDSFLQGSNVELSVECWVKAAAGGNPSGATILSMGNSSSEAFRIGINGTSGAFLFTANTNSGGNVGYIYSQVFPDGNWHQLVAIVDEGGTGLMTFYVDGNLGGTLGNINKGGLLVPSTPTIYVGSDNNVQFNGTIDEVSIYNYAMTTGELLNHLNAAPRVPSFESVPPSVVSSYAGGSVTLSATVLGSAPLTNQWYSNTTLLVNQTNVALTLSNLTTGTNTFTLWVTNAYGKTNTGGTSVQVAGGSGPPVLLTDVKPLSATIYSNSPFSYSVAASGSTPLVYQWWLNGQSLPGATNPTYSIASMASSNVGSYYCAISNSISNIVSSTAVLNIVAAPTNPYTLTVIKDRPSSYWRLDEANSSTIGYDYVGGNNGIYTNTAGIIHSVGAFGTNFDADTAAYFNTNGTYTKANSGTSNYLGTTMTNVDFSVPNGLNGEFSVEAWALGYPNLVQASGGGIVAKGYGNGGEEFNLDVHAGFRFYARTAGGGLTASAQAASTLAGNGGTTSTWKADGNWHHLVGVCDEANDNILLYVDGNLIGYPVISNGVVPTMAFLYQTNHPGSTGTNGLLSATPGGGYGIFPATNYTTGNGGLWGYNSVSIGSRSSGSGNGGNMALEFQGAVDEVALYNYCLTPLQVSNHYAVAIDLATKVSVQVTNGHPVLSWFAVWATSKLQSAPTVNGPWTTIAGAASPYTVTNSGPALFYRVKNQ